MNLIVYKIVIMQKKKNVSTTFASGETWEPAPALSPTPRRRRPCLRRSTPSSAPVATAGAALYPPHRRGPPLHPHAKVLPSSSPT